MLKFFSHFSQFFSAGVLITSAVPGAGPTEAFLAPRAQAMVELIQVCRHKYMWFTQCCFIK
jgi:hypothetical protein